MSKKIYIANAVFCKRSDTIANWEAKNPVLRKGEEAIIEDADNGEWLKIGDGVTPFNELSYKLGPVGPKGEKGIQGIQGPTGDKGEPGADYILTDTDKTEIVELVRANFIDVSEVGQ